jgi:UDP-glucose 4-epimerase
MKILVTGSAGHLGEALMRTLRDSAHEPVGLDILASPFTDVVGSIVDRDVVRGCMRDVDAVLHAATLHKPHVATHTRQAFIDVNLTGTLNLLEEAVAAGVGAFVFTSTTSAFGRALSPPEGEPAAWLTEDVVPVPKNIYGVTKVAAENLCELAHRDSGMPCIVLRTSRFFPEEDDQKAVRDARADANNKANEFLYRRVEVEDVVSAHLIALEKAREIGFARYIVSATTPFTRADLRDLRDDAPAVVRKYVPGYADEYARRGWTMFAGIDRVYDNTRARVDLGWRPRHDFASVIERLRVSDEFRSPLAQAIGSKGYHRDAFAGVPYPVA